jgi:hypothetical protein
MKIREKFCLSMLIILKLSHLNTKAGKNRLRRRRQHRFRLLTDDSLRARGAARDVALRLSMSRVSMPRLETSQKTISLVRLRLLQHRLPKPRGALMQRSASSLPPTPRNGTLTRPWIAMALSTTGTEISHISTRRSETTRI